MLGSTIVRLRSCFKMSPMALSRPHKCGQLPTYSNALLLVPFLHISTMQMNHLLIHQSFTAKMTFVFTEVTIRRVDHLSA